MHRRRFLATTAAAASAPRPAMPAPDSPPRLSFGVIADAQYADAEPAGERHYRATPDKLKQAVATLAAHHLPFTLHLGDLIDRDFKSFEVVLPLLAGLGHPLHHLLGNHDFEVAAAAKCRVPPLLGMPHDYYTFRHAGVRFVMLDTNDISIYRHPPGPATDSAQQMLDRLTAAGHPGAKPWNGGLGETQLAWLDRTLAAATAAGERVLVCGHHPALPAESHQLWTADELIDRLVRHRCVAACLCGHHHAGACAELDGLHFITFRSLLHEPGVTAFSVVHLHPDRLVIEAHGREIPRELALRAVNC
jgi:hypothetical protein